jgi:AmmeMemoRadiSam system protein A
MLQFAARSVRSAVEGDEAVGSLDGEEFQHRGGLFVTLRKNGKLRGCIGRVQSESSLGQSLGEVAVQSALSDPRFPAVDARELDDLEYEISVLTEMRRIRPDEIEIGRHGVEIQMKGRRAIFLPQVATEEGWNREDLLTHLCRKAGLRDDSWKSSDAQLQGFEAEVFGN